LLKEDLASRMTTVMESRWASNDLRRFTADRGPAAALRSDVMTEMAKWCARAPLGLNSVSPQRSSAWRCPGSICECAGEEERNLTEGLVLPSAKVQTISPLWQVADMKLSNDESDTGNLLCRVHSAYAGDGCPHQATGTI